MATRMGVMDEFIPSGCLFYVSSCLVGIWRVYNQVSRVPIVFSVSQKLVRSISSDVKLRRFRYQRKGNVMC